MNAWLNSSIKNKVGTALWALSGILCLVVGILCFNLFDEVGAGETGKFILLSCIGLFVFHLAFTAGLLFSKDVCTGVVKTWGMLVIVADIFYIVAFLLGILLIGNILENIGFPIDILAMLPIGDILSESGAIPFIILLIVTQASAIVSSLMIEASYTKKSKLAVLIFLIFTGIFGGHLFYVGKTKAGIIRGLLSATLILTFVTSILVLIDLVKLIIGKFSDANGELVQDWI